MAGTGKPVVLLSLAQDDPGNAGAAAKGPPSPAEYAGSHSGQSDRLQSRAEEAVHEIVPNSGSRPLPLNSARG
jgi:hypothetical protein